MKDTILVLEGMERLYGFFPQVQYLGFNNHDMAGQVSFIRNTRNFALIFDEDISQAGYLVDDMRVECNTPALVYIEPSVHRYCQVNDRPCRKFYICYSGEDCFFRGRYGRIGLPVLSPVVLTEQLRQLVYEIVSLAGGWHFSGMADRIDYLCAKFIMEMLLGRPGGRQEDASADGLEKLETYIRSHCMDGLDFRELARQLGMSQRTLIRRWQEHYRMPPKQFQMHCRLEVAGNYLKESELPIHKIAAMTGYCDQFAFSRAFRKMTGISPSEWRSRYSEGREENGRRKII